MYSEQNEAKTIELKKGTERRKQRKGIHENPVIGVSDLGWASFSELVCTKPNWREYQMAEIILNA